MTLFYTRVRACLAFARNHRSDRRQVQSALLLTPLSRTYTIKFLTFLTILLYRIIADLYYILYYFIESSL